MRELFDRFLGELSARGFAAFPLVSLLDQSRVIPMGGIELRPQRGRHGLVAVQTPASPSTSSMRR